MTSAIDPTKPTAVAALTADVRTNFLAAANEITALQAAAFSYPTGTGIVVVSAGVAWGTTLGAPSSGTVLGSVTAPAANPATGTPSASNFLRGDGTWAAPAGAGTVTNTGTLTSGKVILGNGTTDVTASKVTLTNPATTATLTLADNSTLTTSGAYSWAWTVPGAYTYTLPGATSTLAAIGVAQTWTAVQTFTNSDIRLLGSSTGYSTFTSANAGASNYTLTFPAITDTLDTLTSTSTLTNKRITPRILSAASYTTDTGTSLNCDNLDEFIVTAQAGALKFNNPTGTPTDGQVMFIAVTGTAARALTYDTQFEASTIALPATTVTTARLNMAFIWRADTSKWVCVGAV